MVTVVIALNGLITLLCLYAAWRVWKLRRVLAAAADALILAEKNTHAVLANAPRGIGTKQQGTRQLRQQYRQLEMQLLKAQQALELAGLSRFVWQWYGKRRMERRSPSQTVPMGLRSKGIR